VTEGTIVNRRILLPLLAAGLAVAVAVPVAGATDEAEPLFPLEAEGVEALVDDYVSLAEGLAAHLGEAGVPHEVYAVPIVVWDVGDPAATRAVGEYLEGLDLPITPWLDDFSFDAGGELPFGAGWEQMLAEDVIDEFNARADALAELLDERDVDYEIEEGPGGVRFVIPDLSDPNAREALEEFWAGQGTVMSETWDLPAPHEWLFEFPGGPGLLRELFGGA